MDKSGCFKMGLNGSVLHFCNDAQHDHIEPEWLSATALREKYDARVEWFDALYGSLESAELR